MKIPGGQGHRISAVLLLIFALLAAGIVTTGYLYYRNYERQYRLGVEQQLSAIAELKASELVQWRKERLGDGAVFFNNESFSGLVRRYLETPTDPEAKAWLRTWLRQVQRAEEYDRIFLLDIRAVRRISVPDTPEPVAPHLAQDVPKILHSGRIAFLDFHRDAPDRPIHLAVLVPIRDEQEGIRPLGVLVLRIDPQTYLYPLINRWPTPTRTAETLIVRREGNNALYLNELRFQKNTALNLRFSLEKKELPAVKAVLGQEGIVEGVDYRGVPVIAAVRAVPDSPWFLVARMDTSEVYAPVRARRWLIAVLVSSLLIGAGAGVGLVWRQQSVRSYRDRYEAAERLRAVSSHQEALLSAVPDIVMEVDNNKVYTWANQAGLEFFGEDVIGKEAAFYFEGEQDTYKTVKPLFYGNENVIYVESWQRRRNGQKRLLAWWWRVLKDEGGQAIGALSSARDITERKQAEEALKASEERFRIAANGLTDVIYEWDLKNKVDWYGGIDGMTGYPTGQFPRTLDGWAAALHPEDKERVSAAVDRQLKGTAPYAVEYRVRTKDGEWRWWSARGTALRDVWGKSYHWIGSVTDITEHKQAEQALTIQKRIGDIFLTVPDDEMYHEVLKVILEVMQSPYGVFGFIDDAGTLVVPSMTRHIWDKCQVPDKTFIFPQDTWGDSSWPRAIREKRTICSNEHSTKAPEGHISIRRHISLPILCKGEVIGLLQVANKETDYTEANIRALVTIAGYISPVLSVRLQRQSHEEELEQKNEELMRFTYTVSHDLKSPLVTIRTFLGYLEEDIRKQDAARVDKDLTYIRTAADKMSMQLDDLLELSRIGRKLNPSVEAPLQAIVQEALDLVAGRIAKRGVQVRVTEEPVVLYGDRPRLVEVFQNLVDNAAKFMGDQPAPCVEIGVEQAGGEVVIFVRDNGVGIDPRHRPKLFGLFEKLDPGTEGTGVGLALVRRIVEVHGGKIWVESDGPGKGATFRFTLAKTERQST